MAGKRAALDAPTRLLHVTALILFNFVPIVCAASEVPVVKAGLGPCSADFMVKDNSDKPIYDVKIHLKIQYGFMGKRSQELQVGTNSDGKARVEGLPDKLRKKEKPFEFEVHSGQQTKSLTQDPETNCHANFDVVFGTP